MLLEVLELSWVSFVAFLADMVSFWAQFGLWVPLVVFLQWPPIHPHPHFRGFSEGPGPPGQVQDHQNHLRDLKEHHQDIQEELQDLF